LSGLAAGLLPALAGSRPNLAGMLKQAGPRGGRGRAAGAGRRGLIALQAGLAFSLMVVSALLINSLWHLSRVDRGFRSDGLLTVHIQPSPRYAAPDSDIATLYDRLANRVRGIPGVTSVGVINHLPMGGAWTGTRVGIDGGPPNAGQEQTVGLRAADEKYLATMGVPLIRGRWFGSDDMTRTGNGGIVINQAMAQRYWPNQDPLGHRVSFFKAAAGRADFGQPLDGTIIGVVGDVRQFGLDQPSDAAIYIPYTVDPWGHSTLVIRTAVPPAGLEETVRRALIAEEPDVVIDQLSTMDQVVAGSLVGREFLAVLVGVFAATALALAMIGLYGVLSRLVRAREREIGIRRAVGADERAIVNLVLREGARSVGSGIALGLLLALGLGRAIGSQLFGISSVDPVAYAGTLGLLLLVALLACYLPARRAARIEPTVALQGE
jgi:putative ABC transport system permease protein